MAKKQVKLTAELISNNYIDYVLSKGHSPHSVYEFAKEFGFEESEFYVFYASFEQIEMQFFKQMFDYTMTLIEQSPDYVAYDAPSKMSAFYFTFMEVATSNRSFIKHLLPQNITQLHKLVTMKMLREAFLSFAKQTLENPIKTEVKKINNIQNKMMAEGAWLQFMSIIGYWLNDTTANFEKTDIYIEKSVRASFDLVQTLPYESVLDLGKFLWKDKFGTNQS